ncbi:MAG TPA: RpiB/LacA/LacB family sugar-phosphate isomerase [Acidobacteriaceae bacterium]|jgi:ribose 5-phosphate isomerase B|nr:RpiB/LacA/LacB family sugar-phosphate isomerase [Acidobacteriaceae bacterium]
MHDMIVCLAADHNGVDLKSKIKAALIEAGYRCLDLGPFTAAASVDYVDFAQLVGTLIQNGDCDRGILICGTGIGMSIAANKLPKVRAAVVHNYESAGKCREHNDANVLCLGSWICSDQENIEISRLWLSEKFGERRHVRRVERIAPDPRGKVVFTNGVFDILHQGHIELLRWSRNLGDRLVVGINSDASARALKGEGRPVNSQENRKAVLQALRFVDEVLIFDDLRPTLLVESLHPAIVVKGGEWLAEEVRSQDEIPEDIEVKIFPLVRGFSSTHVIQRIKGGDSSQESLRVH